MNRNTLMVVDDMEINRAILRSLFEGEYNILEAGNGEQALMLLRQYKASIAAVLLDIVMPIKDGYQVMEEMEQSGLLAAIPVIVVTSQDSSTDEVRAFDLGASDLITKPFEPHVVRRRVRNAVELNRHKLHLEELVEEQAASLRESKDVLMDALSSVIEHRSIESGQHVLRIRMFTKILLEDVMRSYPEYGLDARKIGIISSAASLHDIGKIAIPDAILNKPGKLTPEEFEIMKTHAQKGCEILAGLDRMHDKEYLEYAYHICRYHHERWDGKGYPEGLQGENIPICAQAVSIADVYDALTTDRVYKTAYSPEKAFNMILNGECGCFSPRLLESFKNVRRAFAELTKNYADGLSPRIDFGDAATRSQQPVAAESTLELGQMKYFAMLRYENATVMEVDVDTGVYHLVYKQNNDFDALRSGDLFEESYRLFILHSVHPDDQENIRISDYLNAFLTSGAMKKSRKYRVFHRASGEYVWYEVSVLRINMENPRLHKILLVWRVSEQQASPLVSVTSERFPIMQNSLIGVLLCRNDACFTLVRVNDGFVSMLGYSREELESLFQNRYIELIDPRDRALVMRKFQVQMNEGNTFELDYRVKTKDGRSVWLLDKSQLFTGEDGVEYLSGVLIDVSKTKQEQEELRLSMERYQIIMDQSNDIIFEWNIWKDKIFFSANWIKKFGYQPIAENIRLRIPQESHIFPEDISAFLTLMHTVGEGAPYGETELRIANAEGQYIWCRIRATTQFDNAGNPIKAIGVIMDIDSEKKRTQDLIDKADHDNLTRLYNKSASRHYIEQLMEQSGQSSLGALLILDLDNFKLINDTRGHMFGDAVLMEVATQLKTLFRKDDIVSRIGGDEFLVYLDNLPDKDLLADRVQQLVTGIRGILPNDLHDCPLSCSIGVACYPEHADTFHELFQCCDRALYKAKALGKNQFLLYDKSTMDKPFGLGPQHVAAANTRIESDEVYDYDTANMVQQTFRILYQSGDVNKAVQSILELVGRRYQVSRAYVFEDSEDGNFCSNTFEWCKSGVEPQIDNLQNIPYAEVGNYHDNFDINGIFYCTDITTLGKEQQNLLRSQNICSTLQCAIHDGGRFAGFVGFDDCAGKRLWTQNQINTLTFVSELLSTFLLKKRAQDQLAEAYCDLHTLLDTQNSWIYVIDPDAYTLQYINARTYALVPDARVGMCCHKAFFQRNEPCENCPARKIRETINQTLEVYNPVLQVWTMADASLVRWSGRDACLLACHDITPYKRKELSDEKDA